MEVENFFIKHKRPPVHKYILVDWSRPPAHERLSPKPIELDIYEAWDLNRNLVLNGTTKRYVKSSI